MVKSHKSLVSKIACFRSVVSYKVLHNYAFVNLYICDEKLQTLCKILAYQAFGENQNNVNGIIPVTSQVFKQLLQILVKYIYF